MERAVFLVFLVLGSATIVTEFVDYDIDDGVGVKTFEGFLAYDNMIPQPLPAMVLEGNYFGVGANDEFYAIFWAQQGFAVFAADLFGKGVRPDNPTDAGNNATFLRTHPEIYRKRLTGSLEVLLDMPFVDRDNIVALGFCLGGDSVFELARAEFDNPGFKGIFAFHPSPVGILGEIANENQPNDIRQDLWVQIFKGTADTSTSDLDVLKAQVRLNKERVMKWQTTVYGNDVQHGFSQPFEDAYDQYAANEAMRSTAYALSQILPGTFQPHDRVISEMLGNPRELEMFKNVRPSMSNWANHPLDYEDGSQKKFRRMKRHERGGILKNEAVNKKK